MKSIFDIHKKLGLVTQEDGKEVNKDGLCTRKKLKDTSSNNIFDLYDKNVINYKSNHKVEYSLKKLDPHSFFLFNNEPLLLFFDNPKKSIEDLSKDIWNFNKSALIFVNRPQELRIYNGFNYGKSGLLEVLETINNVTDFDKLNQYSYWKIVTAELWNAKDETFKNNTRVDKKLLDNIKVTRNILIGKDKNEQIENPLHEKHANRIIGRLIFIRYLIDRKVKLDYIGISSELLTKEELPQLILQKNDLFNFFVYLLDKFKGDILPLNGEKDEVQHNHLEILSRLFAGDNIKSRQRSLFNVFDFDFIPVELISNIYETFLSETQDRDKAFYTPPFLVDYVLSQTVKPFIDKQTNAELISCKTTDMTCGSGIFLCETLRTIINKYIELTNPDRSSKKFKEKIKLLLKENIFGNDINQEAVEIAKFSLFITLLDYFESPKDIADFEFPDISGNFYNKDVFSCELDDIFGENEKTELDFILGNPPWGKLEKKSKYIEYCKKRAAKETKKKKELWLKKNENLKDFKPVKIEIGNKEFAQAFLLRLSDFSTKKTVCQVIVTSKLLYNLNADKFRNYFLKNFLINEVLEISSVRHQIFANAVGPAAIIKYKYAFGNKINDNIIDYVSLKPNPYFAVFKTILIEKYDYKEIIQKELIENDWLWKVLVYGHIMDYRFIKRLRDKKQFPITLDSLIEDKDNKDRPLRTGTGIIIGNKKHDISKYKGMLYVNTNNKPSNLQRFYINYGDVWTKNKAERKRDEAYFKQPPYLFIKQGLNLDNYSIIASISYIQAVYTFSIFSIKSKKPNNTILENILGIINSKLLIHFLVTFGVPSIIRERLTYKELYPFPILEDKQISNLSKELIKIKRLIEIHKRCSFVDEIKINEYQKLFNKTEVELNNIIFNLYNLTKTERDLIDYTQKITIPIIRAKRKKFREIRNDKKLYLPYKKVDKTEITDYINIFKEHFSKYHNGGDNGYINVRIFQSSNILAIEFYINEKQNQDQWINEPDNEKALGILASAGFQKVSNELFIQKDIKVLNSNSFSVLKINQYKHWHKAVARLDVIEFEDAMIKSQIYNPNAKS